MNAGSSLYVGAVMHRRLKPRPHHLRYGVFWLLLDLDEIDALAGRLWLFSRNRFNALSFHDGDHGVPGTGALRTQTERHLAEAGIDIEGGPIRLLCMPRIFGYGFNPLSVYFCHGRDDSLAAILYEVHNTFGERHSYLIPVEHDHGAVIRQSCAKAFYVSPFMDMGLRYRFAVRPPGPQVGVAITVADDAGPVLFASLAGERRALTDSALAKLLLRLPLLTLRVTATIYLHAVRLWWKRIGVRAHPVAPAHPVTIARAQHGGGVLRSVKDQTHDGASRYAAAGN